MPHEPPADVFDGAKWEKELEGASGVVSCVGAFGSNEFMERICGDANIHAAEVVAKAGEYHIMTMSFGIITIVKILTWVPYLSASHAFRSY